MRFTLSINVIIIVFLLCAMDTQSTSKYEGISWNEEKKRWQVEFDFKGKKCKYSFENEFDAIRARNRVYKKMGITPQDTEICGVPNQHKTEKTSQYKGVYWHRGTRKWRVLLCFDGQKQKYGGLFKYELDAAKKVNQLCEELGIPLQNPETSAIPNEQYQVQKKEKTSQYKGVSWHKCTKKWHVQICVKGGKKKYGELFKDELDAGKRVNQLCEELGIPPQNPSISMISNQQYRYQKSGKTSLYKGVSWHREVKKWRVTVNLKGEKTKCGGYYNSELDAGKRVNQICVELGLPPQNPTISAIPNEKYEVHKSDKTSQYKGVYWHRGTRKWGVLLSMKGGKSKYGGIFNDELNAAKKVNQLCEELGVPLQNSAISAIPNEIYQKKEKKSEFRGVYWHKENRKWYVVFYLKGQKQKYGGIFTDELNAAQRVNQLCEELGIPPQNPKISTISNEKSQHDDYQTIENPVISSEIGKSDDDHAKKKKRKRKQQFNDDDKLSYFYENLLN